MKPDGLSVPAKLLAIVDAFAHERAAFTVTELARRAGLPLTTTHRLVGELEQWGGLERGPDRRYRIGLRFVEVAALCPRGPGLRDVALPIMEDLYEACHQNVQLAVRAGTEGVYVERIAGRQAVPVLTKVGARWPLHATGVGLACSRMPRTTCASRYSPHRCGPSRSTRSPTPRPSGARSPRSGGPGTQ